MTKITKIACIISLFLITSGIAPRVVFGANTLQQPLNILGLQNGLTAWYTFDGKDINWTTGQIVDRSGSGYTGQLMGQRLSTTSSVVAGKSGQAFLFKRSTQMIDTTSDFIGTGAVTVSAWIYAYSYGDNNLGRIFDNGKALFFLSTDFNAIQWSSDGPTIVHAATNSMVLRQWQFVTATRSAAGLINFYINGVLSGNANQNGGTPGAGTTVTIGNRKSDLARAFDGIMDDVRIYNRELSAAEINQLYEVSSPSRQNISLSGGGNFLNGLVGWWTFDAKDVSTGLVIDRNGGNNGTIVNMATSSAYAPGKISQAFSFRGNRYIDAGNGSNLNLTASGTIAFWAKTSSNANDPIVCKQDYVQRLNGFCADIESGKFNMTLADASNSIGITSAQTWNDDSWHEVVSTWDGSYLKMYVDGIPAATDVAQSSVTASMSAYQGTITKPAATGLQSITGVGFKPKVIIFLSNNSTAGGTIATSEIALGAAASTSDTTVGTQGSGVTIDNATDWHRYRSETAAITLENGTSVLTGQATLVSMDSNGFTLNWTTADANQSLISYIALGGDDITDAKVISFTSPTAVGDQANTSIGFQGDFMMLFSTSQVAAAPTSATNHAMSWGFATRAATTTQFGVGQAELGGVGHIQMGRIHESVNTSAATLEEGSLKSFDANGFTMEWAKVSGTARYLTALVIKGGNYSTGVFNQNTSAGTQSVTGLGYKPVGLIMNSQNEVTGTSVTSGLRGGMGMTTGTSNRATVWSGSTAASSYSGHYDQAALMKVITNAGNGSITVNTVMDFSSFDSSGFTVNNTTVDATSREMAYAAFGPTTSTQGPTVTPVSNVWNLNFGRNSDTGTKSYYSGLLDDVRILNRTLSASEVASLYRLGAGTKQNTSLAGSDALKNGLEAWWTFDGGDMPASSGNVINRVAGAPPMGFANLASSTLTTIGRMGQALSLRGTGYAYANQPPSLGLTTYTISAWVKIRAFPPSGNYTGIVVNGESNITNYAIYLDNGSLGAGRAFRVFHNGIGGTGFDMQSSTRTLETGVWYHVVGVMDLANTFQYIYINGVLEDSGATTVTPGGSSGSFEADIGRDAGCTGCAAVSFGQFDIDDARIYSRALSQSEVLQLYKMGK